MHDANKILGLSPEWPYAMAVLIDHDWENARGHLAEFRVVVRESSAPVPVGARRG